MQTTKKHVEGAFNRLHNAMGWPKGSAWNTETNTSNVGAVTLDEVMGYWSINQICNEAGGETVLFRLGKGKREAFDQMANMASAVEMVKRGYNHTKAA